MRFPRSSGILLHITSLPSRFGIGDLGPAALKFVDFLNQAGQSVWQILPLCPATKGNSPYSCYSALAGNPLLISLEAMVEQGWLTTLDEDSLDAKHVDLSAEQANVDFAAVTRFKHAMFRKSFAESRQRLSLSEDFQLFCREKAWWLDEFSRFEALMQHFHQPDWTQWPHELVQREAAALAHWDQQLAEEIEFSKFQQFLFDGQWNQVKQYANQHGVKLYGDLPIFVAHESVDVWANQALFYLDDSGNPTLVAGVPPDYFSETGQLWGNPLYRWDVMEANHFAWWTARFRRSLEQFDLLRVDHFRGFESYWEIPADATTAVSGRWRSGPQEKPFAAAAAALGELPIIAEDLGLITQEVHDLRDRLGFPPMRVLQFGFDNAEDDFHRPETYPEHCVAYTGTHDNETVMGWFQGRQSIGKQAKHGLLELPHDSDLGIHLQLIQMVLESAADTAIIPLQDVLGLGDDARMNVPGEAEGNWKWRVHADQLTDDLAAQLLEMAIASDRCSG
jgi:4-alpha-glucanotransferase